MDATTIGAWTVALAGAAAAFAAGYSLEKEASAIDVAALACPPAAAPAQPLFDPPTKRAALPKRPASQPTADPLTTIQDLPPNTATAERERLIARLGDALGSDGALQRRVFAAYLQQAGAPSAATLAAALSAAQSPAIEQAALEASSPNRAQADRLASLKLLRDLDTQAPSTRAALLESLRSGGANEPALIAATLAALDPRGPVLKSEQAEVNATLAPYLRAGDAVVRRQTLVAYTAWAPKEAGILSILKSATQDPDAEVRLTAVSAIARTSAGLGDVRDALLARMRD